MRTSKPKARSNSKLRRRVAGMLALTMALLAAGGLYAALAPEPQTAQAQDDVLVRQGEQVYNNNCITCHGANLDGVQGRGPSLIGVGEAAVYFQTSTGRMPMIRQEAQAHRKPPRLDPEEIDAVSAFVHANGGGPQRPEEQGKDLIGDDPSRGAELFRLNCASCHNFTGRGIALSSGKYAPPLAESSEQELYLAMLTGPQNMPKFSDRQLTPEEKEDIIAYVVSVSNGNNAPGGNDLGGWGPGSEGVITWVFGMAGIIAFTLWIGSRVGHE